jgi:hypothetical protein
MALALASVSQLFTDPLFIVHLFTALLATAPAKADRAITFPNTAQPAANTNISLAHHRLSKRSSPLRSYRPVATTT